MKTISKPDNISESPSFGGFYVIIFALTAFLYLVTSNISYQYHQQVVPFGDHMGYPKNLMVLIDSGQENYFSTVKSVFTSGGWYWLYKLPAALLSPFLSKEPSSLCLINYILMAIGTLSFFRVARRVNLSFNATLLLTLSLWIYPWIYGLQNEIGLFNLMLESTFYWILVALAAHMIVYALEPKSVKNAVYAGVFTGLAIWGRGNSLPYVLIVLAFPGILILYRLFKVRSNRKRMAKPLALYFMVSGILVGWFFLANYQIIFKYYGETGHSQVLLGDGYFAILFNEFEFALKGWKYILLNFPGAIVFRKPFSFSAQFATLISHLLVVAGCVLAVKQWKRKRTRKNRLLALCGLTGVTLFYGMLLMALVLLYRGYGHGWHGAVLPFRLLLVALCLNVFVILAVILSKIKVARVIQNPMFVPTACLLLVVYGFMMSKVFTPFSSDKNSATASDVERFTLNLESTLHGGNLGVLWAGKVYSTNTLRYYRLKGGIPPPNLYYSHPEERPLIQRFVGDFDKHSPIPEFRKLLERGIKGADYLIIPEDIKSFDYMPGQPGIALRKTLLAEIINSPDSPKFGVKMILHDSRNIRLLLLKRLRRGKNPENLDLLIMPYGNKDAVYPQIYPKAGSDIYQAKAKATTIPYGPRFLFDLSPRTFWEPKGTYPMKEWVELQFETKIKVDGYKFDIGLHQRVIHRMPVSWELQASSDGKKWETIDARSGYTQWKKKREHTFWIKSPEEYNFYRLMFTKGGQGHGNRYILRIYEIKLLQKGAQGKASEIDNSHFDWYEKRSLR